jgi:lipopolysaccharide transport system permease protein
MSTQSTTDIHQSLTVIEQRKRLGLLDIREFWSFRELLWMLAQRDIKVRYKQTALGAMWAILRPTLTMVIFSIVFGRFAKIPSEGAPYPVFVFAGLLPWMFFAQSVSSAAASVLGAGSLITRVYFPRLIVPLASVGVALVDLVVALLLLAPLMVWYNIVPGWSLLAVPLMVVVALIIALGVGIAFAAVSVVFRDFRHIEPFIVQIWMFATPVIYPASLIPAQWRWLAYLNPMSGVVEGFRACWLGLPLDWTGVTASLGLGLLVLLVAVLYFERVERRFADVM